MQSATLVHWLSQLTEPDTEKVKQATKQLQSLSLTNDFLLQLFQVLRTEGNKQIRISASVLLRRKLSKSSSTIPKDVHETLKHLLLEQVQIETDERIQKSLLELIGTIAKQDLQQEIIEKKTKKSKKQPKNEYAGWKEYLHLCGTLVQSTDKKQLELGMYLFATLATYCGEFILQHWPHTFNLITTMLKTRPTPIVCQQALIILTELVKIVEQKQFVQTIQDLVPIANEAVQYLFVNLEASKTTNLLDFYEALIDCELPNIIGAHLESIISTCLQIAVRNDPSITESVRYNALNILAEICRQKKKVLLKHASILPPIIQALLQIISSTVIDTDQMVDEEDEPVVVAGANHVLEAMSYHLAPEKFVPLVISQVEPMLKSSNSNERKAAYYVLSGIIDGCCDYINNNYLEPYMTALQLGLQDTHSDVTSAALLALGETCAVLEGEISKHSVRLLPLLMDLMIKPENMQNYNLKVIRIYYAVEEIIGVLNEEHQNSIPEILKVLFHIHASTTDTKIRELVLSVYPAIATVMKEKFAPFLEPVITQLSPNLSQKPNEDTLPVFCTSLHTLASLCRAVGTDHCKAILTQALEFSINLYNDIDEPEFRSAVFALGGAASRVFKSDFNSVQLNKILGYTFESLRSLNWIEDIATTENRKLEWVDEEEIVNGDSSNEMTEKQDNNGTEESDDDNDDDNDDDDDDEQMTIENAHIEEKAAAVEALGDIIENCLITVWPHLKDIVEQLKNMLEFPNSQCSQNAVTSVGNLLVSVHKMIGQTSISNEKDLLQNESDRLLNEFIPNLCTTINTSTSRSLAQISLDTVKSVLEEYEFDMLKHLGLLKNIADSVQKVLNYKAKCQQENEDEDDEGDSRGDDGRDDAEYDAMLISTAGDLLPALTSIASTGQVPFFEKYLATTIPKLQKRLRHQASVSDRSFVIGVLAETVQNMNEILLHPFLQSLFTMFYQYLLDDDEEVRTNACFGLGVLCQVANQQLVSQYETILARLSHVLTKETNRRMIDNVCSCLCRMIVVAPRNMPLGQVLPVIFQHLPLQEDFAEVKSIFTTLNLLYDQYFNEIEPYLPKSIEMAASVIDDTRVSSNTVPIIREFLRSIYNKHSTAFVQVMQTLNESLRLIVTKHLQTN